MSPWRWLPPALTVSSTRMASNAWRAAHDTERAGVHLVETMRARLGALVGVLPYDSGTSALATAMRLATTPSQRIALPAFGCYDLVSAALGAERGVVAYDVDPTTLAPDMRSLATALEAGVGAVVVAPLFGYAPPMPAISDLVKTAGAALIEDIAQGGDAAWEEVPLGSWGDFVVFSFGRGKGVGGAGGGALAVRNPLEETIAPLRFPPTHRSIATLIRYVLQHALSHPRVFALPSHLPGLRLGETVYSPPTPPEAINAFQCAVASDAFVRLSSERRERERVAIATQRTLCDLASLQFVSVGAHARPGFLRLAVLADDNVLLQLRHLGMRRSYPIALSKHELLQPSLVLSSPSPGAELLAARLATLPTHHHVRDSDIAAMRVLSVHARGTT